MFPHPNGAARPPFLILETSQETLEIVQQLDFSSFADSDGSQKMDVGATGVNTESDDPFDSDDLQELLKIYPSNSPNKGPPLGSFAQCQNPPNRPLPLAFLQAQNPSQEMEMKIKIETPKEGVVSGSTSVQETLPGRFKNDSSPDNYFSCKSETEEQPTNMAKTPLLNKTAAAITLKTESPTRNSFLDACNNTTASTRPFSPQNMNSPVVKRARFSSPEKFQSYESQMQYRQFSTKATEKMPEAVKWSHDTNPSIQLATQPTKLNLPDSEEEFTNDPTQNEPEKVVRAFRLSKEQNHVLELAKKGKSIFFTGSAGTGKSILLKSIIKALKEIQGLGAVAVTASTGLAACNIGGITLHSFAGIGLGKGDLDSLVKTVKKNRKVVNRWKETQVLIIDEISMVDGVLFHNLDQIARKIRRRYNSPFGGIQVIICGDFYQLPPVSKEEVQLDGTAIKKDAIFAFESQAWDDALDHSIVLKEVFRQKGDQEFIDMLNEMRHGIVSPETEAEFRRLSRPLDCPEGIVPTELYATRDEVERANNQKLQRIQGEIKHYIARDGGSLPPHIRSKWLLNFMVPRELVLKENAQVMCVKNIDDTLVNGSLGKIIRFVDRDTYMCEKVYNESPHLDFEQFEKQVKKEQKSRPPEAYSDSVFDFLVRKYFHESKQNQGEKATKKNKENTEENAEEKTVKNEDVKNEHDSQNLADPFEDGNSFVSIENENIDRKLKFIKELQETSKAEKYPLVRFLCPDGVTTRDHLMEPERWEIVDEKTQEVLVFRVQFPLMLAWALSIHKSQGQTLQKVRVVLTRTFENGQAYVALSRAVSRNGLQVLNFRGDRVRAHPTVESFYRSLTSAEEIANLEMQAQDQKKNGG